MVFIDERAKTFFFSAIALVSIFLVISGVCLALIVPAPDKSNHFAFQGPELLFALAILGISFTAMWVSRKWNQNYETENIKLRRSQMGAHEIPSDNTITPDDVKRHLVDRKMFSTKGLFVRDIGPLTFDVATHSDLAEVAEYRGIIHWHRDVIEKLLSIILVLFFSIFLGRFVFFLIEFLQNKLILREAIISDSNLIAQLIGLALILDGLLLVASMTDAPGIGRTLDSMIVVLSGVVITYFVPSDDTDSAVRHLRETHLGLFLIYTIAALFLVRWIIRHHTIAEWIGADTKRQKSKEPPNARAVKPQEQ